MFPLKAVMGFHSFFVNKVN